MRNLALIVLSYFLCSNIYSETNVKTVKKSMSETDISWDFVDSDISIKDSQLESPFLFKDISIESWSQKKTVGAAALPFKSFLYFGDPKNFKVELNAQSSSFIDGLIPSPAQKKPCRCDIIPWKFSADYNEAAYDNDKLNHISKEFIGVYKGKKITRITISPISYNHKRGARVVTKGSVSIKAVNGSLNSFSMKASDRNYRIFAHQKYEVALRELISHREKQGIKVSFHALRDLGTDYLEIRESIKSLYASEPFSYALIVGHEEEFPTEYVMTRFDHRTPSDMHYYTMDGDDDVIPDVLYGRISVSNEEELSNIIRKTLEFENRTWRNPAGASEMIAIASDEGSAPNDVEYVREMQKPLAEKFNWKSHEYFQANESGSADEIVSRFNKGSIWLNYIGHGTGFEWPSVNGREFSVVDISSINSGLVKPVVIDVACQNGRFSNEGRMGETFLRGGENNSGAVAYYGGSVDISWDPPAIMAIGINRAVSENNKRHLADVIFQGQSYLLENMDDREAALENLVWYHLQGDPLLNLSNLK